MRVLVVEDRSALADTIAKGLRHAGMAVDIAYDGERALELATINAYDVIVLDRDLPKIHGDSVCAQLVGGTARILMLTASGTIVDRVEGLNLGADDYLSKPFSFEELVARIRALARRRGPGLPPVLSRAGITLDLARHEARRDGRVLELTKKEFAVLEVLLSAEGGVVSSEELLERVWDENANPFTNAVRVVMGSLRRKLGDPPVVHTVHGVGYRCD